MSTPTIPRKPIYPASQDFQRLRQEGIQHIERFGSDLWTDYNLHDPGITMLEVLCYALTDLGYRTALPMRDLLATPNGNAALKPFFSAAEILSSEPVTANDYRKILIDIDGVKNAWVEKNETEGVYFQLKFEKQNQTAFTDSLKALIEKYRERLKKYGSEIPENITLEDLGIGTLSDKLKLLYKTLIDSVKEINQCLECENKLPAEKKLRAAKDAIRKQIFAFLEADQLLFRALVLDRLEALHKLVSEHLHRNKTDETNAEEKLLYEALEVINKDKIDAKLLGEALDEIKKTVPTQSVAKISTVIEGLKTQIVKLEGNVTDREAAILEIYKITWSYIETYINLNTNFFYNDFHTLLTEPIFQLLLHKSLVITESEDSDWSDYNVFTINGIYHFYLELEDEVSITDSRVPSITKEAWRRLYEHRNLGEDFFEVTVVEEEPICVCANIEIAPEADPSEVLAQIYYLISEYLSPTIPFYSLEEMLDRRSYFVLNDAFFETLTAAVVPPKLIDTLKTLKDFAIEGKEKLEAAIRQLGIEEAVLDEYLAFLLEKAERQENSDLIFDGPMLANGFIDDHDLEHAELRQTVYKSDIYQEIMKVPGVKSISSLEIDKCERDEGKPCSVQSENWCISLDCICKPVLDLECTKIYFSTGGSYFFPNPDWVQERFEIIKASKKKPKPVLPIDLPFPQGSYRPDLTDWTSIQEDFPNAYKIGRYGIASNEPNLRKAQAKQLKGYLLFFDQIMTNYLAQLGKLKELMAVQGGSDQMQFFQPLYEVPNVKDLLVHFDMEAEEGDTIAEKWGNFKDRTDNNYIKALQKLVQGVTSVDTQDQDGITKESTDIKRLLDHSKLLDHLLARFGEQFSDHVSNLYKVERPTDRRSAFEETLTDLIGDKKRLLREIDRMGRERAKGFNYRADVKDNGEPDVWETDNVEGLKKRVSGLEGFTDSEKTRINYQRRTITCVPSFVVVTFQVPRSQPRFYNFGIKEDANTGEFLMKGAKPYQSRGRATAESQRFFDMAANTSWYGITQNPLTKGWVAAFWENPTDDKTFDDTFLISDEFVEQDDAKHVLSLVLDLIDSNCEDEGFHIVEHILLRPKDKFYKLLHPLCMPPCQIDRMDPYSFWVTIIAPDWVNRFKDEGQLYRFEQAVRREAPAHVSIQICLLERKMMYEFETIYYDWLYKNALPDTTPSELRDAVNKMIDFMNTNNKNCRSTKAKLPETVPCTE